MFRTTLALCAALLFTICSAAITFTGTDDFCTVHVELNELGFSQIDGFTRLNLPEHFSKTTRVGIPELPVYRTFVPTSANALPRVHIANVTTKTIHLDSYIFPRQNEVPKNLASLPFEFDENWYAHRGFATTANGALDVRKAGRIRGYDFAMLEFSPVVKYDPTSGELEFITSADIIIESDGGISTAPVRLRSKVFDEILTDVTPVPLDIPAAPSVPAVYWIIYYDGFESDLAPFVQWKKQMGYNVVTTPISDIGTTATAITDAVRNAYTTWAKAPDFVLLVGDAEQIPSNSTSEHYTDLYYFTVDGDDYYPDILYGRFSCATSEQVRAVVQKCLTHEKFQFTDASFLTKPVFLACGTDGDWELAEGTHRYVFTTWLTAPRFEPESLWAMSGASGADVTTAVNAGAFLVNYSGHGGTTGWGNPSYSNSDVAALTNQGKYPLVISNACQTGTFVEPECFAEAWQRADNKGALCFIGASNSTYWGPDDIWERRFYDAIFAEGYTTVAGALYKGNLAVEADGSFGRYYFEVYHHFGDPALWLYWGTPEDITVDLTEWSGVLPLGESFYSLPVSVDSTTVCITRDDTRMGLGFSTAGLANVAVEFSPTEPGEALIVATKPNFFAPFIRTVENAFLSVLEFAPESLLVNSDNAFSLNVVDGEGTAFVDAMIIIEGLGFAETVYTDALGDANAIINPPYGNYPVTVKIFDGASRIAVKQLNVYGGIDFTASVHAGSAIVAMHDTFAVGFTNAYGCTLSVSDFEIFVRNAEIHAHEHFDGNMGTISFDLSAATPVEAIAAKRGYNVCADTFPSVIPYGALTGRVIDLISGTPSGRPRIRLLHDGETIAQMRTDFTGNFALPTAFLCDSYTVEITGFGYRDTAHTFLLATHGVYNFTLQPTDRSSIIARVKDGAGMPLDAEICLISLETNEALTEGSRLEAGTYDLSRQPYSSFLAVARRRGFSPVRTIVTPTSDFTTVDLIMSPMAQNALIIDCTSMGTEPVAIRRCLDSLGFGATVSTAFPDTATMWDYNLVVISCGTNSYPLDATKLQTLLDYVNGGGRIIFEGGDVAYQVVSRGGFDVIFSREVMHLLSYELDVISDNRVYISSAFGDSLMTYYPAFLTAEFTTLPSMIRPTRFDKVVPTADASVFVFTDVRSNEGVATYFPDAERFGFARSANFCASFSDAYSSSWSAPRIFGNLVERLLPKPFDKAFVYGHITLSPSGTPGFLTSILSTSTSGAYRDSAYSDGRYMLDLPPNTYDLLFERVSHRDTLIAMALAPAQKVFLPITLYAGDYVHEFHPEDIYIGSAMPNPFNSAVAVEYYNPFGEEVCAKVYDFSGRAIATIEAGKSFSGELRWVPQMGITSGIYFIRISIGKDETIKKAVYLR